MKKILLTILLTSAPVYALQNGVIISDAPVKSIKVESPEILEAKPIFTIDNDKKTITITPKQTGKTYLIIDLQNNSKKIKIDVRDDENIVQNQDGFEYFAIDEPEFMEEIPLPPESIGQGVE